MSEPMTLKSPPVSVAMATYNGERFLEKQIQSLLAQSLPPAEIIVCDDASTDGTLNILRKYEQNGAIKLFVNEQRLGLVDNFKKAVSLTSPGHYIALCDQDDIWLPAKLEQSVRALVSIDDRSVPSMIYSDLIVINQKEEVLNASLQNEMGCDKYQHCFSTLLFGNFVLGCTVLMNEKMKSLFADIPQHPSFNHDSWITLIGFTFGKASALPHPYILYRKHEHNVTFARHRKSNRLERIAKHIWYLFNRNNYLQDQLILLKQFYSSYEQKLSDEQKRAFANMFNLEKASYLKKKLVFENFFKGKWVNRF